MYHDASVYYNWYLALALIIPVYFAIYYLTLSDGDALFTMLGSISEIIVNAVLSIIMCKKMGINGLGFSSFISYIVAMIINCLRFFSRKNSIKFDLCLNFGMLKKATVFSFNSALNNIFIVSVRFILNKIIIISCGSFFLPGYTVVSFVLSIFLIFGAVGDSARSLCSTYYGEENNQGVKNVVNLSYKSIVIVGILMMWFLLMSSPFIHNLFGITTNELIEVSFRATIIVSLSAIPFGFCYFCYQIYSSINRPLLSLLSTFLFNFLCPLMFSIPLAFIFGFDGICIGISIASFASIGLFYLYLLIRHKKEGFPLYLTQKDMLSFEYDFVLSNNTIVQMRDEITTKLENEHYDTKIIEHLFEELLMKIYEKNNNKKVRCECFIFIGTDFTRIIVRDSGVIFNFVEQDNSSDSLNTILLNSLLENIEEKEYLITSSVNRNGFIFRKQYNEIDL